MIGSDWKNFLIIVRIISKVTGKGNLNNETKNSGNNVDQTNGKVLGTPSKSEGKGQTMYKAYNIKECLYCNCY